MANGARFSPDATRAYVPVCMFGYNQEDVYWYLYAVSLTQAQPCYASCDGSTTVPVLNVADFTYLLQRFAAGCL